MTLYNRLILFIYALCIAIVSIFLILISVNLLNWFPIEDGIRYINGIRGNYIYSLIGIIFLIVSMRFIYLVFRSRVKISQQSYLVMRNDLGEIIIYSDTIIGLAQNVINKFTGINSVNTKVEFIDGQVDLVLRGEIERDINIPQISKELQLKVKDHIESFSGAIVRDIKIEITNVSQPNIRVK